MGNTGWKEVWGILGGRKCGEYWVVGSVGNTGW